MIGDSHHYARDARPVRAARRSTTLILDEYAATSRPDAPQVIERWTGTYASAPRRPMFIDRPADRVRLVMVTSGTGASTGFAIGEETVADLYG